MILFNEVRILSETSQEAFEYFYNITSHKDSAARDILYICSTAEAANNEPDIKVLFTWADGIMGKPGYVYQACSFLYGGYATSDIYLKDGVKIHPRQTRSLFIKDENDTRKTIRPTYEQMQENNMIHIRGRQFKYLTFLCSKVEKKHLLKECLIELNRNYPKEKDLKWEMQTGKGKWEQCDKPYYKTDFDRKTRDIVDIKNHHWEQTSIYDYL